MGCVGRGGSPKHIATYGRGDFVGGLGFLDHRPRSNDAIAVRDCDMYVLTPEKFDELAEGHKRIAFVLVTKLARMLAIRLRHTNDELTLLQDH
jgi:SulP family sulfate permease